MKSTKYTTKFIGILILTAYLMLTKEFTNSKIIVFLTDILSGLSVIGIPILLKPYLQKTNKLFFNTYLGLKFIESILMILGGIFFLNTSLQFIRNWIYESPHLFTFIIGGFLFYWLLLKSKLIPKFISIWGLVAIFSLALKTILGFLSITNPIIDTLLLLIIANEVFLAIWLMTKGLKVKNTV